EAPAAVAPEPQPEPVAQVAPEPEAPVAPPVVADEDELTLEAPSALPADEADELVLGSEAVVPAAAAAPEPPREPTIRRRWLTGGDDEEVAAPAPAPAEAPKAKTGGTLFERMAAARNGSKDDDDKDPLDIPRFLNRQNNQ
ncbi:MAG: cell division protein FtsZ, partial [Sphingomonas sp.]